MLSPRYWTFLMIVAAAIIYSMIKPATTDTDDGPADTAASTSHPVATDAKAKAASGSTAQLPANTRPDVSAEATAGVITSPVDPFEYRHLTLENGMQALLVSTPDTDKAAAAVSVAVGSGDDPKDREGLAHFLEHMLFLGTEPYPESGEYQAYISRHGGSHNAFTAHQQTTYFFSIDNNAMSGALDRFAPFFISPTFDEAYVDREKNAVHAEYTAKIKDDSRRIYNAEKQAMNPDHPFAKFATGNLDTLSDRPDSKIRDELLRFYENHYSADRMTLVLAGNYPLSQLELWANSHFNAVPKRDLKDPEPRPPLFISEQMPLDVNIVPEKEIRRLQLTFALPETRSQYQYKPLQLLGNLLGHEGEGSILALLKEKGWAEALSAGQSLNTPFESSLVVQVNLTRAGLLHVDDITQSILHYIELMKTQPLPEYLLTEQQQLSEMAFRFQEHGRISDYVVSLSTNLLHYPANEAIYGDYVWQPISPEQLKPYIDALSASNMLRTLIAPGVTTDMEETWYSTPMRVRPSNYQPKDTFKADLATLHLPEANPFIPTDFDVHAEAEQATPALLQSEPGFELWYYPEHEFQRPKARIVAQLFQQNLASSAARQMAAQLYVRAVNENLNTFTYPAYLAGLGYNLNVTPQGLQLSVSGYQDKLPELLERLLAAMKAPVVSEAQFERYKASLQRRLENQLKSKPYERSIAELKQWLYQPSFSEPELLQALQGVTLKDTLALGQSLQTTSATRLYVHGNLSHKQSQTLSQALKSQYPPAASQWVETRIRHVPAGQFQHEMALDHQDTNLTLYMQGPDTSDQTRATMALLGQILSAPYYQYMRTEQQLGYIVFAAVYPQRTVPGLVFIVQSPGTQPQQLMDHSVTFWKQFEAKLAAMSAEEFQSFKDGLVSKLIEPPKNMGEKAARYWREIDTGREGFDTNSAIAELVKTLTLEQVQSMYQDLIIKPLNSDTASTPSLTTPSTTPWLLYTQGGDVEGFQKLSEVARDKQPLFALPPRTRVAGQ